MPRLWHYCTNYDMNGYVFPIYYTAEIFLFTFGAGLMRGRRELFKKLNKDIWEFRSKYNGRQFRMLAFWDKTQNALVIATHGFIKKSQKTPLEVIEKAEQIMRKYYMNLKYTTL